MSSRTPSPATTRWYGPGELARQTNTSIKALRVYEKAGLLSPDRREGGWRQYGPTDVARLHQILALKALGLSLKQIRAVLERDGLATSQILDLQAWQLAADIRTAQGQLKRVQRVRAHLAKHGKVPFDFMLELARNLAPSRPVELAEIRAIIEAAAREQGARDAVLSFLNGCIDGEATETRIGELLAEAAIAAAEGDPGSERSSALADRWLALASTLNVPGDEGEEAAVLRRVAAHMVTDPRLADTFQFLRAAVERRTASEEKG